MTTSRSGLSSVPSARSMSGMNSTNSIDSSHASLSHMDHKVLFVASLVFYPLLWIFWFTSVITTTMLCDDAESKWHTLNAACAFTWLSWFATSASCYIIGRDVWEQRSGEGGVSVKPGDGQTTRGKVKLTATTNNSQLQSSGGSRRGIPEEDDRITQRVEEGAGEPSASAGSRLGRTGSKSGRPRDKSRSKGREGGRERSKGDRKARSSRTDSERGSRREGNHAGEREVTSRVRESSSR